MKRGRWLCGLLFCASLGCGKAPTGTAPPEKLASSAGSVGAAAPGPAVTTETEIAGLRVRAGTLAGGAASPGALWGFSELELAPERTRLEISLAPRGAALAELLPARGLAVVNGGYFEADFRPSTWLKSAGRELAPKSETSKGGLLAVSGRGLYLGPFSGLTDEPELAVQSFPLLVEPQARLGIYRDDGRRAARTVVCSVDGRLHFIVISAPRGEGPTLFEAANLLRAPRPQGFGCGVALNLDGGPSTGVWFAPELGLRQRPPIEKVAYAIAIMPR